MKNKGPKGSKEQLEELGKEGKTEDNNYFMDERIKFFEGGAYNCYGFMAWDVFNWMDHV